MARVINARLIDDSLVTIEIEDGVFSAVDEQPGTVVVDGAKPLAGLQETNTSEVFDAGGATLVPSTIDAHVHSRDPGLTHKEDWASLRRVAYRGGVGAVCDMPNTIPPTMDEATLRQKAQLAADTGMDARFFMGIGAGNITSVGRLLAESDLPVCGAKVYYGQSTGELMYSDLEAIARLIPETDGRPLVFHSEDQCRIDQNALQIGPSTSVADHSRIRSSDTALSSTRTILDWARRHRRCVHIAHLSTPLELELIQEMRQSGFPVTTEVAPHHLIFTVDDYDRLGAFIKVNPPIRSAQEVSALKAGFGAGCIDVYATDHAPHTREEKEKPFPSCPSGIPSLEAFYPLLFKLAKEAGLDRAAALAMATRRPAELFGFPDQGQIAPGFLANFVHLHWEPCVWQQKETVSKCGWTPYDGLTLPCSVRATWIRGQQVYATG